MSDHPQDNRHLANKLTHLRILQTNTLLNGGGTDDQCIKLAQGLDQLGQKVWIAGPDGRASSNTVRDLSIPYHVTPPEGPFKLKFILDCARFIREKHIQIVHGHHGRDYWPTILAARLSRVQPKIVLSRHMPSSPKSIASKKFLLGRIDALVAVSEFTARVLKQGHYEPDSPNPERHARPPIGGDHSKIRVAYGGIDTNKFGPMNAGALRSSWGTGSEDFLFGIVGSYDLPRGKGQPEFLKAASRIHEQHPNARFLIIGRGNMADALKTQIQELGLSDKAVLTPYATNMPEVMNALDCLVHPAVGIEALGLVICEAHACGTPVIANDLDGIPEAFAAGKLGKLIQPESVEELANAMSEQLDQPRPNESERHSMHRKVAKVFSLDAAARRIQEIYRL